MKRNMIKIKKFYDIKYVKKFYALNYALSIKKVFNFYNNYIKKLLYTDNVLELILFTI